MEDTMAIKSQFVRNIMSGFITKAIKKHLGESAELYLYDLEMTFNEKGGLHIDVHTSVDLDTDDVKRIVLSGLGA